MNIEEYKDNIIDLYKKFIPVKSVGPDNNGEGEWERAKVLYNIVKDLFDEIKIIEAPDERIKEKSRPNIIAIKYGKNREKNILDDCTYGYCTRRKFKSMEI